VRIFDSLFSAIRMTQPVRRREFIALAGGAAAWPLAQWADQLRQIGMLTAAPPEFFCIGGAKPPWGSFHCMSVPR
jgi:hypothetical protein